MLVPSPRHRPEDLELWSELEGADLANAEGLLRSGKLGRSLAALREFLALGPAVCGVSWGKDSLAVAHLLRLVSPLTPLVHLRPTNHNPDSDAVRDAYFRAFPGQPYAEVPVDYGGLHRCGLPHQDLDRETDRRWHAAIRECERRFGRRRVLGIRADESTGRRIRTARWGLSSPSACAPVARWSAADVFAYLALYGLPVHPAYAMLGGGRWPRERLRVAEIGDTHGTGSGRREWEESYYGDVLRRLGL